MRLTALQLPARFDAAREQLALAQWLLEQGPPTDVVLFPEAALTGYLSPESHFDLTHLAEPLGGPTQVALGQLARRFDCLVVGPLIERATEGIFNSLLGITPEGTTALHYRKRHPWYPETWATAGHQSSELVRWRQRTLMAAICFDVHFLEEDAAATLEAADLLLFASAWVEGSPDSRGPLLSGLSRRHRLSVLNANWGPGLPRIEGQGGSLFIDALEQRETRLEAEVGRLDVTVS